jgi:mRNA-degrading endonuclease YafQ of YafQ-DinJ toxin-antitoxin module
MITMWKVLFSAKAEKDIQKLAKEKQLSESDKEVIATWIKQVQEFGPESLQQGTNFWYDHELYDEWKGHRSSAYSFKGRLIYRVEEKKIVVLVVKVTATHDYSGGSDERNE